MQIHEPMTMATDYLLALFALVFAVRLVSETRRPPAIAWTIAFGLTACAAIAGGTFHGLRELMSEPGLAVLWKLTMVSVGGASMMLALGLIQARFSGRSRIMLSTLFVAKFAIYVIWIWSRDSFLWVIIDYGITILFMLVVEAWHLRKSAASRWIVASLAISIVAAAVQQSGWALHEHFNHNDLYHLIQIVALWLLYRGGVILAQAR